MTGEDLATLERGSHRLTCPDCGRSDRDRTMGVTVERDRTVWHCYRCGQAGARRHGQTIYTRTATPPAPTTIGRHVALASNWRDFYRDLQPIEGSPVAAYLNARCCEIPRSHVRYAPALRHPSGYVGPAMVALVTDAVTREPLTLHRTWIKPDGTKADVEPARMLLGKHRKQGGVIRLFPDDAVTTALAIGEGVETMLTAALEFKPCWSAIDAGNLAGFPVLAGIESLLIVADNDAAGLRAADECAERWCRAGREVRIAKSPIPGQDLNDFARAAA